jgi:manganese transport protein
MGAFVNAWWLKAIAWTAAFVIAGLNAWLLAQSIRAWMS